jgi:hypothetical protein
LAANWHRHYSRRHAAHVQHGILSDRRNRSSDRNTRRTELPMVSQSRRWPTNSATLIRQPQPLGFRGCARSKRFFRCFAVAASSMHLRTVIPV